MSHYKLACIIVASRDFTICRPLSDVLYNAGLPVQRLVPEARNAREIIVRADTEGGAPIVVVSSWEVNGAKLICELIDCDTLPARPYVLVGDDTQTSEAAQQIETEAPLSTDRVQIVTLADLKNEVTGVTLGLHLSRVCKAYLRGMGGNPPPAPITEMPIGERSINNIDRRNIQRGMFPVAKNRVPYF